MNEDAFYNHLLNKELDKLDHAPEDRAADEADKQIKEAAEQ